MSEGRKRAAVYVRISNDREGRAVGVEGQEADCRALCARRGWEVAHVYSDNDLSASTRSNRPRPQYRAMLASVDSGEVDAILSYSTSRLTRRPREFEDLITLAEHGVTIATVKHGDIDLGTARGRRRARDDAARDAEYAEEVGELVHRAKEQTRAAGGYQGGPRAFGWRPGYAEPDPAEAPLVVQAVADVLDGVSLAGVAARWQAATGGTPSGRRWRPNAVRVVLRNPRHAGLTRGGVPAAAHPGIVEADRWRGLLALLDDPARRAAGRSVPRRLLTGIAACGVCGGPVHGGVSGRGAPIYRCATSAHVARACEPVDRYVAEVLLRWLARERVTPAGRTEETAQLARHATGLRARLAELADLVTTGDLSAAEYRPRAARLRGELEAAEGRLAAAARGSVLGALPPGLDELRATWDSRDLEWRRAVLQATEMQVAVHPPGRGAKAFDPATVQVSWRQD